jgi:micrococcal nuclease
MKRISTRNVATLISAILVIVLIRAGVELPGSDTRTLPGGPPENSEANSPPEDYSVVGVVDGDTVKISIGGETETYRLIGVDTPETVHPTKEVECFGLEASNRAKSLLTGTKVRIETDSSQGMYDKYGRRLAYIFLEDGTNFNLMMIREGYSHEYTYGSVYKYQSQFKEAEATARTNKVGLWADDACVH